ncbi:MAG: hypothetical protein L0210_01080 [Rhodospirillales bacterium]|nr:hypothetical protein [Rhodospirillales bacterium]
MISVVTLAPHRTSEAFTESPAPVFVNELHYDNAGQDRDEAIEIAGPAGTNLGGWRLVLYNGSTSSPYHTRSLSGIIPGQRSGFGTLIFTYPTNGLQNGVPDGIALIGPDDRVVQFLSYGGGLEPSTGPAAGLTSTDIGVAEAPSTPQGQSLQLTGTGRVYQDFTWRSAGPHSYGTPNADQTFLLSTPVANACPDPSAAAPLTAISTIQGADGASPLVDRRVTVRGMVTARVQGASGAGIYVQAQADADGDPLTSDGL